MNKKLILGMFAAAGMLLATSCTNDEFEATQSGNEAQVSFDLELEGHLGTKAISDGTKADKLVYAVYKLDANGTPVLQNVVGSTDGQFVKNDFQSGDKVTMSLAKGQTYQVAFWAQDGDCNAYDTKDLTAVKVDYTVDGGLNNDELRDAFFKTLVFEVTGNKTIDVVLKRPFAQVNLGVTAEDWEAAVGSGINIKASAVAISSVANEINLLTGAVSGSESIVYNVNDIPEETLYVETDDTKAGKESYKWISMSYILVADADTNVDANGMLGSDKATLDGISFRFTPEEGNEIVFSEGLNSVPVQRNWRTNILGKMLTGDIEFNITIDPVYENDIVFPEKGNALEELEYTAAFGGTYTLAEDVTMPAETPWLGIGGDFIFNINEGVTLTAGDAANYGLIVRTGTTEINGNGNIKSNGGGIAVIDGSKLVFNGGNLDINTASTSGRYLFYLEGEGSTATINGGNFDFNKTQNQKRAYIYANAGTTVYVKGGNFGKASTRANYSEGIMGEGTVIITGGTFGFDPTKWVAEGYSVIKDGATYIVGKDAATVDAFAEAINGSASVNVSETIDNGSNRFSINNNDAVINLGDNEIIAGGQGTNNYAFNIFGSEVVFNGGKLNGAGLAVMQGSSVTVNNGTIAAKPGKSGRNMFFVTDNSTVTVNEGTYTFDRTSCYFVYVDAGSTCIINGGHFEKALANNATKDSFVNNGSTGTVIIKGGTFNMDPTAWLADGYKAVKEGNIWTVSAE